MSSKLSAAEARAAHSQTRALAFGLAAGLLAREHSSRGATLTLYAKSNPGLKTEISLLRFRGVECGRVTNIRVLPKEDRVAIEVQLQK